MHRPRVARAVRQVITHYEKIAFIIVRYGENINGGAEVHCQMLAERLLPYYEVEVLTTTIRAFNHPDQDYTEGVSSWNGVTIRRFKPQPIDQEQFRPFRKNTRPHAVSGNT